MVAPRSWNVLGSIPIRDAMVPHVLYVVWAWFSMASIVYGSLHVLTVLPGVSSSPTDNVPKVKITCRRLSPDQRWHQGRFSPGACWLPIAPGFTQGRTNQDELNAEDKFHIVLCTCDKNKEVCPSVHCLFSIKDPGTHNGLQVWKAFNP